MECISRVRALITAEDVVYLQPQWLSVQYNKPVVVGATWTYTSQLAMGERRSLWLRAHEQNEPAGRFQRAGRQPTASYTGVTVTGSLPADSACGFYGSWGQPGLALQVRAGHGFPGVDYVSYLHGNHAFKFGADFRRNLADPSQFGAAKGAINFRGGNALENFLAGVQRSLRFNPEARRGSSASGRIAGSVQDDWRIIPRLTVNLGLRYDYATPMAEAQQSPGRLRSQPRHGPGRPADQVALQRRP